VLGRRLSETDDEKAKELEQHECLHEESPGPINTLHWMFILGIFDFRMSFLVQVE
jgi:hypothetical protein